jgi:hypothetical protein
MSAELKAIFDEAHEAGIAAVKKTTPTPMIVSQHANMLDDSSPVEKAWWVDSGACGFAWINIHPGTSKAARYAKKYLDARVGYPSGMQIWVSDFGQSVELKEAYANAFAAVLRKHDIKAYAGSRLD